MSIDEVCPTCTRIALRLANEVNAAEKEIARLKAENASLHGMATALGKQCAELERDRNYNAELRDEAVKMAASAEQRNTALEGALRQVVDAFTVSQEEGGPRIAIQRQEALQAAIRAVVWRGEARP